MIDILGRAIHDGDIVVAKGSAYTGGSDTPQKRMEVGVAIGNSIYTLTCHRSPRDIFLVVNPSKDELAIKERIIKARNEKIAESKKKAKQRVANKADEAGSIYITKQYLEVFLYLGYRKIEAYADGVLVETKIGNVYLSLETWVRNNARYNELELAHLNKLKSMYSFHGEIPCTFDVLKGTKTIDSKIGECIDFKDEFTIERKCTCKINGKKPYDMLTIKIRTV